VDNNTVTREIAMASTPTTTPETWVESKRSYCETCDTDKKNVQWWSVPFKTPARPQAARRDVYSACGTCKRHVPKAMRDMPLSSE
jgi:hypothetical protein